MWVEFDSGSGDLQFEERWDWIPTLGVQYLRRAWTGWAC